MVVRGRGKGAVGGAALSFWSAVERAVKGVGFLGDLVLEFPVGREPAPPWIKAFSEERREDVMSDFFSVTGLEQAATMTLEDTDDAIDKLDPAEDAPARCPVKDDDVRRTPRFAASLVMGPLDLTTDITLPFARVLDLTEDGRDGALVGLEGPAAGRIDTDKEEGCLERRGTEELEGTGMRDLEGEL